MFFRKPEDQRKLAGQKALELNGQRITTAIELCQLEGLTCDSYGCPEEHRYSVFAKNIETKARFDAARRVAQAYKPHLLSSIATALGDEIMAKLGAPEQYLYPQSGRFGHEAALAYCKLKFEKVDKDIFRDFPQPKEEYESNDHRFRSIIPDDLDIEISHAASFGIFDPGYGEQYLPGDLLLVVGVKTVDEVTSYYSPWRFEVNPKRAIFLKNLRDLDWRPLSWRTE